MFVADHNSAVRRNFKSRAMPEKEIPPARLVDIYLKNKKSEHILNKCSHNILSGGADGSRTRVQK